LNDGPNLPEVAERPSENTRGGWLTAFLVVMIVANAGAATLYFLNPGFVTQQFPRLSHDLVGPLLLLLLVRSRWTRFT